MKAAETGQPSVTVLLLCGVFLFESIPAVLHGKAAVRPGRQLDIVYSSFIRHTRCGGSTRSLIGDELLRHVVVSGIDRVMQLPKVFQFRRRFQTLESRHGPALLSPA